MLTHLVSDFIAQHTHRVPGARVKLADLIGAIRAEAARHGLTPLRRDVTLAIEAAGYVVGRHRDVKFVANLAWCDPSLTVADGQLI